MKPKSSGDYLFTPHARYELERRGLDERDIRAILASPEQSIDVRPGRVVFQSKVSTGEKTYLVRVFVDVDRRPAEVVTAYRTSKISKYWQNEP